MKHTQCKQEAGLAACPFSLVMWFGLVSAAASFIEHAIQAAIQEPQCQTGWAARVKVEGNRRAQPHRLMSGEGGGGDKVAR
jgi:hypothetical protein